MGKKKTALGKKKPKTKRSLGFRISGVRKLELFAGFLPLFVFTVSPNQSLHGGSR